MTNAERFRFLHGPYEAPKVRLGRSVMYDEARGVNVIAVRLTDARIAWPIGRCRDTKRWAIVVCHGLAEAVRCESNQAVCHWFGVTPQTVSKWRKALGIKRANEGTHRIHSIAAYGPGVTAGRAKAHAMMRDPLLDRERRRRMSEMQRGRKRPASVVRKITMALRARYPITEKHRLLAAHNRRVKARQRLHKAAGWTAKEDIAVRTMPPAEAAMAMSRTIGAIYARRSTLGKNDGRTVRWQSREISVGGESA